MEPMMSTYYTSFHKTIKTSQFENTFGIEPRIGPSPNPDLRIHYSNDHGTKLYQRPQKCQQKPARQIAMDNNEESIEKSVVQFNKKMVPPKFEIGNWVLQKVQNFLGRNKKLA